MSGIFQIAGNLSALSVKKSNPKEQSSKNVHVVFPLPEQDTTIGFFLDGSLPSMTPNSSPYESTHGLSRRTGQKALHYSRMNTLSFQKRLNFLNLETLRRRE